MDAITAEFHDMISGRIPEFEKTTVVYPELQVQRHEWNHPFKEGGNKDKIDEITFQVSTIFNGIPFYEQYTVTTGLNDVPAEIIVEELKRRLIINITNDRRNKIQRG